MRNRPDIIHYHALGPGLLSPLPRFLSRSKVVLTVHGLDHERAKWGSGARAVLKAAGWVSARIPDATVGVSHSLAEYYARHYRKRISYIPNGVTAGKRLPPLEIGRRFGLERDSYVLFVGRLVPEKAPDLLIRAFRNVPDDIQLVIAGGSSFTNSYAASLRRLAALDSRVMFPGYVFGSVLDELYTNAAAFVLPSTLEGLPLTLLEASSYGTPIVASNIPPHIQIVMEDGPGHHLFTAGDEESLAGKLIQAIRNGELEREEASRFSNQVATSYRWDDVAEATERLYLRVLDGKSHSRSSRQSPLPFTSV